MTENLDSLIAELPDETAKDERVDVSSFFSKPEGEVVFVYRDPPIAAVFKAGKYVLALRKANPDWPENLAMTIAMMVFAHAEPVTADVLAMYSKVVNKQNSMAQTLINAFAKAYPHLLNVDVAADAKKNE